MTLIKQYTRINIKRNKQNKRRVHVPGGRETGRPRARGAEGDRRAAAGAEGGDRIYKHYVYHH